LDSHDHSALNVGLGQDSTVTLARMFLTLLLVLVAGEFIFTAISLGWSGPGSSAWRFMFVPALGLLWGAWAAWPR
jgi:hypothetical protein